MSWLRRLRDTLFGARLEDTLEEEIRFHLEQRIDQQVKAGVSYEEARAAVLRRFGNAAGIKQRTRDADTLPRLGEFLRDVRGGFRHLRRSPGFSAAAIATLALGIGANAAIASVIDVLMLRTLSVREPEALVTFGPFPFRWRARFDDLTDVFAGVTAVSTHARSDPTAPAIGEADADAQLRTALVTANYFQVLGVQPSRGRAFIPDDDAPVAVISDALWRRRFHHTASVQEQRLALGGATFTIVGVLPAGFSGEHIGQPTDVWLPDTAAADVLPELNTPAGQDPRGMLTFRFVGRLRPGVSAAHAQAAATDVYRALLTEQSTDRSAVSTGKIARKQLPLEPMATGVSPHRQTLGRRLTILMGIAALLLAIACANVANLLLARGVARQREMAIRSALGASRRRLVCQLLTENMLLAAIGGIGGFLLAWWGGDVIGSVARSGGSVAFNSAPWALDFELRPGIRLVVFTAGSCLLTAAIFGIIPVFSATRVQLGRALGHRPSDTTTGTGRFRVGRVLVAAQIALAIPLLVMALLFARELQSLRSQDLGVDRANVLMVWASTMQSGRRAGPAVAPLFEAAQERIGALPGVLVSSASVYGFLNGNATASAEIKTIDVTRDTTDFAGLDIVMPRYFEAMGMRVLKGRDFTRHDSESAPRVVVINQALASRVYGPQNPIGRRIGFGNRAAGDEYEIVGVVNDSTAATPYDAHRLMYYKPYRQDLAHLLQLVVVARTTQPTPEMRSRIREELRGVDARLPVLRIDTVEGQRDRLLIAERMMAMVSLWCSGLAATLTGIGLYGVISYLTTRRQREIGIRLALGASGRSVIGRVVGESVLLAIAGVVAGIPLTVAAARVVSAQMAAANLAADSGSLAIVSAFVVTLSLIAGGIPASRACRLNPVAALRDE